MGASLMAVSLHTRFLDHLAQGIDALQASGDLPAGLERTGLTVEQPHNSTRGDLSTNAAMVLANLAGTHPRQLAKKLAERLATLEEVAEVDVAGPGFINLRLTDQAWRNELAVIAEQKGWVLRLRCFTCLHMPCLKHYSFYVPARSFIMCTATT